MQHITKNSPSQAIKSKIIATSDAFKVRQLSLEEGAVIKKHTTPVPAFLLVLKGEISFHYENEKISLSEKDSLTIKANEIHWLNAEKESEFLLIK